MFVGLLPNSSRSRQCLPTFVIVRYAQRITVKRKPVEVEFLDLLVKTFRDHGIDVDEILRASRHNSAERGRRLAERLAHSVLPLFVKDARRRPDRIGSCVLVRVESRPYAFTAGHVLEAAGSSQLFASPGPKGKLLPLPSTVAHCAAPGPCTSRKAG
jgi:hypothetical protein